MPDLSFKRTSQTEMRLAHSFIGGWIFAAIGGGVAWAGANLVDPGAGRWMVTGMGLLFAAIGIGGGLWRFDLTLDLMARVYRGRRGFWPSPRRLSGSLDELEGVVLTRSWRRSKNSSHAVWIVNLAFRDWDKPTSVFETTDESKGYRKFEELVRQLQVAAIDRTGESEVVRSHDQLDRSVAEAQPDAIGFSGSTEITSPPPDSGIELGRGELGGTMIVLPAAGVNSGVIFLALFGLPFFGFGLLALSSAFGVSPVEVKGTLSAMWIVGGLFTLFGVVMELGVVFGTVARQVIRTEGESIVITLRAFGKHYRRREMHKRSIEEIAVKESRSARSTRRGSKPPRTQVVLRTDEAVVRIAGDQPADRQQWLAKALLALASRT